MQRQIKGKRSVSKQTLFQSILIGLVFVLLFVFQNCTQPMVDQSQELLSAEAANVPFAYDTTIDQIAYMSCAAAKPGSFDNGAYFTFRFGAYRNAGLKLNDAFNAYMIKKSQDRKVELFSQSPANAYTDIQLALRSSTNYQRAFLYSNGTSGLDYANVLEPLGTPEMNQTLLDPSSPYLDTRIKYLRNGTVGGSRLEGSLYFTDSFASAESVRQFLMNDGLASLTYTEVRDAKGPNAGVGGNSSDTLARAPSDVIKGDTTSPIKSVFGHGYKMSFGRPFVGAGTYQFPTNILSKVDESNLDSTSKLDGVGQWTCPANMQFRIVRYEDVISKVANVNCVMGPDPLSFSSEQAKADLMIVRNSLRQEDWYVDMTNSCIVAKKSGNSCYGATITSIQYKMSDACSTTGTPGTVPAVGSPVTPPRCVDFVSLCYRTD
jgi:hypothetical protein